MPDTETMAAPPPAASTAAPPAPTGPAPAATSSVRSESYAELDAMDLEETPSPPPPKPVKQEKQVPPQKPAAGAPAPTADAPSKEADGGGKESTAASSATTEGQEKPIKAAELRGAYERTKQELKSANEEIARLKSAKPADDPEKKTLLESLEKRDSRIKELEQELAYADYTKTDEYKQKYEQPFMDAYAQGRALAADLDATEGRQVDADGNVISAGKTRPGTAADFDRIMSIQGPKDAYRLAKDLFGEHASLVIEQWWRVRNLGQTAQKAVDEFRKNGSEKAKEMVEQRTRQQAEIQKRNTELAQTFDRLNGEAIEKYPHFFKAEAGDAKGAELLKKGFERADIAFKGGAAMTPDKLVELHSAIRNKAGAFDYLAYRLKLSKTRISELETELAAFNTSTPGGGSGKREGGAKPASGKAAWESELDALDRQGK